MGGVYEEESCLMGEDGPAENAKLFSVGTSGLKDTLVRSSRPKKRLEEA